MRYHEISEAHHAYDDIKVDKTQFQPLKAGDTLRVFHGFRDLPHAVDACMHGMSGRERAQRVYSYEFDNNPKGVFVTLDFKTAGEFGATIIEFVARSEELEAPVWPGGSYTVQGQYSQYFGHGAKGRAARNARRKAARAEVETDMAARPEPEYWSHVTDSDDQLTANMLLNSHEHQALFIGDLNPDRIVAVYSRDQDRYDSTWTKHTVAEFLEGKPEPKENRGDRLFSPGERFDGAVFLQRLGEKYHGLDRVERTIGNLYADIARAPRGRRAQTFLSYFDTFLWPGQYRDALLWMRQHYGRKPVED